MSIDQQIDSALKDVAIQIAKLEMRLEAALDLLDRIAKEAIEHWPDAETWEIIQEAQDTVASKGAL